MFGATKYENAKRMKSACIDCLFFSRVENFLYYGRCLKLDQYVDSLASCPYFISARDNMQKYYEENRRVNRLMDLMRDVNEYAFVQDYQSIDEMLENFHVQDDGIEACVLLARSVFTLRGEIYGYKEYCQRIESELLALGKTQDEINDLMVGLDYV